MDSVSFTSFAGEFEKIAIRRGVKEIARLVAGGKLDAAQRIAKTPGVLSEGASRYGSSFKALGKGGEGVADLVAHPTHGVAARKIYNPYGVSSPALIARKEVAGKAIGANPNVAQYYGAASTPSGARMHFNEFVPTAAGAPKLQANAPELRQAKANVLRSVRKAGFHGAEDVRRGNMVLDARTGTHKAIDYIPTKKGEFGKAIQTREAYSMQAKPKAHSLFNDQTPGMKPLSPGQIRGKAFTGAVPQQMRAARPVAKSVPSAAPQQTTAVGKVPAPVQQQTAVNKIRRPAAVG